MNKKFLYLLIVLMLLFVGGIFGYNYIYQDHRNISTEEAEFTMDAEVFLNEFTQETEKSNGIYLDKTIELKGMVSESNLTDSTLVLNEAIYCLFSEKVKAKAKTQIRVKCRVVGYDDLMGEIQLDQCTMVK